MNKYDLLKKINLLIQEKTERNSFLLTEQTLQTLHSICCPTTSSEVYRKNDIEATGIGHRPPHPDEIEHFMKHFISQLEISRSMFHPIEFASIAYKRLLDISPFVSHNEETAALFLNVLLVSEGYPIIQDPVHLPGYEKAMEKARSMPFPDTDELTVSICEEILRQL